MKTGFQVDFDSKYRKIDLIIHNIGRLGMKSEFKKSFFLRKIGFQVDFGSKYQKMDRNLQNIGY